MVNDNYHRYMMIATEAFDSEFDLPWLRFSGLSPEGQNLPLELPMAWATQLWPDDHRGDRPVKSENIDRFELELRQFARDFARHCMEKLDEYKGTDVGIILEKKNYDRKNMDRETKKWEFQKYFDSVIGEVSFEVYKSEEKGRFRAIMKINARVLSVSDFTEN